jgi:hypothetical protein
MRPLILWFVMCGLAGLLPAQFDDPMREIQEIAREVEEQMREIDRLLLESSQKNQARSKPKELLQRVGERSQQVEGGIDRLIEKLTEMKNQSSSSSSSDSEQQQQQQQQKQQGSSSGQSQPQNGEQTRRENNNPEFVDQGQKGQGQQPSPKPDGQPEAAGEPKPQPGQPQGGQEAKAGGDLTRGNQAPPGETGPGNPGSGEGSWGELQPYMNFLKNRGSAPKVPEKYRKYWDAYLKQKPAGK